MESNFTSSCRLWSDQVAQGKPSCAVVRVTTLSGAECVKWSFVGVLEAQLWRIMFSPPRSQAGVNWMVLGHSAVFMGILGHLFSGLELLWGWAGAGLAAAGLCSWVTSAPWLISCVNITPSQVCREGPHFCLGCSFLNPEWTLQSRKRLLFCYHTVIIFSGFLISSTTVPLTPDKCARKIKISLQLYGQLIGKKNPECWA